jgi:DNA-binding winged helix-turn-helix (wHTH) protein/lipopolysaccharide biosynthesis regulator YciM
MDELPKEIEADINSSGTVTAEDMDQAETVIEYARRLLSIDPGGSLELATQARDLAEADSDNGAVGYSLCLSSERYSHLGDYRLGIEAGLNALSQFEKLEDRPGMARALECIGRAYDLLGDYSKGIEMLSWSLSLSEQLGDKLLISRVTNTMGSIYFSRGDYPQALRCFHRSYEIRSEINDLERLPRTLNNLGVIYSHFGEYEKAVTYHFEAMQKYWEAGDCTGESFNLVNLGETYMLMGDYDSALEYLTRASESSKKNGVRFPGATASIYLGKLYRQTGDYEQAFASYQQGLSIAREISQRASEAEALIGLGELFCGRGKYGQAIDSLSKALSTAQEIGHSKHIYEAHHALSETYELQGEFVEALSHYKAFYAFRQKIYGTEADKNLKRVMIGAVENAQKEAVNYQLKNVELAARVRELEEALSRGRRLQSLLRKDPQTFEFGPFRLEEGERRLLREGQPVPITGKAFDVLLLLVQNGNQMVEKAEIMREVWQDCAVEDNNVTVTMSMIRKTLGTIDGVHEYIETVPRRGYRFASKVTRVK